MAKNGNGNGNGKAHQRNGANGRGGARKGHSNGVVPSPVRPGRTGDEVPAKGTLVIIGGHEDKKDEKLILRFLADRIGSGKLVVATVASDVPDEVWADYEPLLHDLGVKKVVHLHVKNREEAKSEEKVRLLDGAAGIFFTGGDQLKLTSQLGDSPIYERMRTLYRDGGLVAGTSAGASVVCETMLVGGAAAESHLVGTSLRMAPGFGLIPGVIIDQHFAQRGRIGRLVAAVAQNPRILGIGIDEDTAIVCDAQEGCFRVLGSGAVYIVDGQDVSYTNLTEEEQHRVLSVFGIRMHLLSMGDEFDLATRTATNHAAEEFERELIGAD
jgi:cyanophycinase